MSSHLNIPRSASAVESSLVINHILEAGVRKAPDQTITYGDRTFTYRDLNERVHRLAGALAAQGVHEIVINHAYLGEKIVEALGDGSQFGARIQYSPESEPLNTGAGIARALPLLGNEPFIVCNGDVWTDYDYSQLLTRSVDLAHLVMVPNPEHNLQGDFSLNRHGRLEADRNCPRGEACTYSGISLLHPDLFKFCPKGPFPLRQPLIDAMNEGRVTAEWHRGAWTDVGTPQRLAELERDIMAVS